MWLMPIPRRNAALTTSCACAACTDKQAATNAAAIKTKSHLSRGFVRIGAGIFNLQLPGSGLGACAPRFDCLERRYSPYRVSLDEIAENLHAREAGGRTKSVVNLNAARRGRRAFRPDKHGL